MQRLPITAHASLSCLGSTEGDVVAKLKRGARGLSSPSLDVPFDTYVGEVPQQAALPADLQRFESRGARLALASAASLTPALNSAFERWGRKRVAMVFGTSTGGIDRTEDAYFRWHAHGDMPADYHYDTQHVFDAIPSMLAEYWNLVGPRWVVSTACSSSAKAFASAQRLIDSNIADAVIVAGVDALCHTTVRGFHSLGVMASELSRPFGANRPGMNVGEAAAFLLVERDGDPRGYLVGVGESSDAHHMSSPHPEGEGAQRAMRSALASAGIEAAKIDLVNAHGTGTKYNDAAESIAIGSVFQKRPVPVVSTKALTGHTLGACGALEAIFCLHSLEHGFVPAAVGAHPLDEACELNLPLTGSEKSLRYAMSFPSHLAATTRP